MQTFTRTLINLDILNQDLRDIEHREAKLISSEYQKLLHQYLEKCQSLFALATSMNEHEFSEIVTASGTCAHISSKRMLGVQIKLIQYVLDFYSANAKIKQLQANEFDSKADKRLDLLQTKAVKARSQFKTVAKAMGKADLQEFARIMGLPKADWSWEALAVT